MGIEVVNDMQKLKEIYKWLKALPHLQYVMISLMSSSSRL